MLSREPRVLWDRGFGSHPEQQLHRLGWETGLGVDLIQYWGARASVLPSLLLKNRFPSVASCGKETGS